MSPPLPLLLLLLPALASAMGLPVMEASRRPPDLATAIQQLASQPAEYVIPAVTALAK